MNALRVFALILGIGAVAAWALGGDWRLSFGMWVSLTITFWMGRNIGHQEAEEWASDAAEDWLRKAVESGAVTVHREVPDAP